MRSQTNPLFSHKNFKCNPEDLLNREPIVLDPKNIAGAVFHSIVLITGAAGSIGSELALQISGYAPKVLILIDQSETLLNDLDMLLRQRFQNLELHSYVANVTDVSRMSEIFSHSQVQIVFHAAAYKHVPVMEKHPYEAIKTNVLGTGILADLAITFQVRKFVFISTDKAIRPSSVMGATKRLAEIYLQSLCQDYHSSTQFVITRFGNVLGSNGSFLRTFERQIQEGGPITLTHPDVQRYVMTVSEACQLVLEASAMSKSHEILFFDMGGPLRIADIARRMIELAGLRPDVDIRIEYMGMRPGEKLHEDLIEDTMQCKSHHPKIRSIPFDVNLDVCVKKSMSLVLKALDSGRPEQMVAALKMAVPEYISANSVFEKLDVARLANT
ncbi:polysaccharide biosynthesis protein [Dyadobacter arcticus]|uniref:FlaA1/EpsC-like NDP-sugar epimerase n=1 Tax=Dyadobacter arcticus TaxID=1078754 RepID=A0ABX0UW14_9BACT|nr:polysaccharide biosynthesis protein [Dyadobacter arcticus]NIJ56025.1 FlaA1/EpsC-like NDP-sugar epimerase [Dyadobacter arcticus]